MMARENFGELLAFIAVARERSFTRAAAQLGVTQSALSQTIQAFETKLGVRLLTRTTRSVSLTGAGESLLAGTAPRFEELEAELAAVAELRDKPSGMVRITATEHAADTVLWPRLGPFLFDNPDIQVEIAIDYGLSDIVASGYDLGVRLGDEVGEDMIAVRIGPDLPFAVVGSPAYFENRSAPRRPQDLRDHSCINLRLPTHGGLYTWELRQNDQSINMRVEGRVVLNGIYQIVTAAEAGLGLAFIPADLALPRVADGRLVSVLEDCCPVFPGFHLYYASRRQPSRAVVLLVDALRHGS